MYSLNIKLCFDSSTYQILIISKYIKNIETYILKMLVTKINIEQQSIKQFILGFLVLDNKINKRMSVNKQMQVLDKFLVLFRFKQQYLPQGTHKYPIQPRNKVVTCFLQRV